MGIFLSPAVAAEAAGLQDKFWEMHNIIFKNQQTLDTESILLFARIIRLDIERFKEDTRQKDVIDKVGSFIFKVVRLFGITASAS